MATRAEYADYFLNTPSNIIQYETLEISHPNFSQVFYVVRNNTQGIRAILEDGVTYVDYTYYPLKITPTNDRANLDQSISIEVGDLGELIPQQLDLTMSADTMSIKPVCKYRTYRSDRLDEILYGPLTLEIDAFAFNRTGAIFEAKAPVLNISRTGELYTTTRFPMLRGFL